MLEKTAFYCSSRDVFQEAWNGQQKLRVKAGDSHVKGLGALFITQISDDARVFQIFESFALKLESVGHFQLLVRLFKLLLGQFDLLDSYYLSSIGIASQVYAPKTPFPN